MSFLVNKHIGVSTVIASAILIGGVAVIGSGIVLWANSKLSSSEIVLSSVSTTNTNKFNEFLAIENVWFCKPLDVCLGTTPPKANVTITNIGTIGLNVTQIKIVNSTKTVTYNLKPSVPILPAQSYIWANTYTAHTNLPVNVTITTARGSIFVTQVTPP